MAVNLMGVWEKGLSDGSLIYILGWTSARQIANSGGDLIFILNRININATSLEAPQISNLSWKKPAGHPD